MNERKGQREEETVIQSLGVCLQSERARAAEREVETDAVRYGEAGGNQ